MRPSIGVLITYFNERHLLGECLRSLGQGEDQPDEILVYDDDSYYPAADYVPEHQKVRVIRSQGNRGPAYGRNVLLRASRCDYIHFHDADDLFHPDWVRRIRQVIERGAVDAVFTEVSSFDEEGRLLCDRVLGLEQLNVDGDLLRFCIRGAMLTPAGTYRREVVLAIGGYREALWQAEDYEFHIRLAASGIRYVCIAEPLVFQRIRCSGRSKRQDEVWLSALEAIRLLAQELPPKYHQDLCEKAVEVGQRLFRLGLRRKSHEAFHLSYQLGRPAYSNTPILYRVLAYAVGPYWTECIRQIYRVANQSLKGLRHGLK